MEALFSTTLATYEAWIMLLCVIVFLVIYLFDGISFVQRVYTALRPAKPQGTIAPLTGDEGVPEVTSPILEPIAREEVEAHEAEKAKAEEKHEQEVIESEVFEEKVLEEIKEQEKIDETVETRKRDEDEEVPVISSEAIAESRDLPQEEKKEDAHEESEEVIENDLEEKEKIEEELPDVTEEIAESVFIQEDTPENNVAKTEDASEDALKIEAIEIGSELQEGTEALAEPETIEESTTPSEVLSESSDIIEGQAEQEGAPEGGDTTEEKEFSEEDTNTAEEQASSEESHVLPITASIPEVTPEVRKSTESQYTERLYSITNEVKTLIARGNTLDARALIIQGLALDKNHRELNLILGSIYESERQAQKAEYIYKDLALAYPEDGEILERLANILIIEKRYDLALEIYKKITSLSGETEGSLYIMTHLAHELSHHEELYAYARRYQKNWPNNPDILTLLAQAEIALGERQSAIQTLIKLKNLTPYNNEIMETIAKLTMEEELAGNFGSERY